MNEVSWTHFIGLAGTVITGGTVALLKLFNKVNINSTRIDNQEKEQTKLEHRILKLEESRDETRKMIYDELKLIQKEVSALRGEISAIKR